MKLDLNKEFIEILFEKGEISIEIEQEQASEKIPQSIQIKLDAYIASIDQVKSYMKKFKATDISGAGFSIDFRKYLEIVYDFGLYDEDFEEHLMRLTMKLDYNLNIIHSAISLGFMGTEFIYKI